MNYLLLTFLYAHDDFLDTLNANVAYKLGKDGSQRFRIQSNHKALSRSFPPSHIIQLL